MNSRVEALVHDQMAHQNVRRIQDGYEAEDRIAVSRLRFLPATGGDRRFRVVSIAEISTTFSPELARSFSPLGVAVLNSQAVYGAYLLEEGQLSMRAQYTVYEEEPAAELAARMILDAFAAQMPFGCSNIFASASEDQLRQQRAYQECPRTWQETVSLDAFESLASIMRGRGIVCTPQEHGITAEIPLSGSCPSRMIERDADTALLVVTTHIPHPVAGVGYLATIALPTDPPAGEIATWCARLNALELRQVDFVPRLGAWGVRGVDNELVYSQFLPMNRPFGHIHQTIMSWMVERAAWLRRLGWERGRGLTGNPSYQAEGCQ